jgi:iron complex outermembrane recepter protein
MRSRVSLRAATAALAIGLPSAAWAQQPPAPTAEQSAEEEPQQDVIGEVTVTARRVEESLQDTPVSVSVVTSDMINQLGLNSIDDFARQSTGISFSQAFGRSTDRPVIRGQSNVLAGVQAGVETGAAYFVDGIYYQGDIQGFDPQSIERVEIIKGPQSALYGRNTYAGAINYITRDPTSEFTVSGRLRAAQHDEYEAAVSLSGPIIPGILGFRAGGRYYTYGGEYTNQLTGRLVGDEETTSAYATLVFTPTDDIRMRTRLSYQRDDDGPLAIFLQGAAANNCFPGFRSPAFRARSSALPFAPASLGTSNNNNQYFCGVIQPQPNNIRLNTDAIPITIPAFAGPPPTFATPAISGNFDGTAFDGIFNEQYLISNIIEWDIGGSGWVISSLTGYRDNLNLFGTDSDHSDAFAYFNTNPAIGGTAPNPLVTEPAFANTNRDEQNDFSQEIRLRSPQDHWIRGQLGLYYFRQEFQSTDITFASGAAGLPLGTDLSQFATIEDLAIFGQLQVQPFEELTISGELRYAEETKTLIDRSTATNIFCAGEQGRAAQFGFTGTCRPAGVFDGWDPRVTIDFQPNPRVLVYGVFARGRKPGGFNGTAGVTAAMQTGQASFVTYQPEISTGGEIGFKYDTPDRRFRFGISLFYNELSNVQLTSAIPNPAGTGALTSIVTNSGDAETRGFEIEARAIPTRGLDISLGVSYVHASFTRGCDADEFILRSGGLRPNFDTQNPTPAGLALCDITGRRLPLGSPWTLNGSVNYTSSLGSSDLEIFTNANFSYEDSKFVQVHNQAETGEAFLLNGRIGIRGENFSVALFGRNLTDEDSINLATRWFDLRYGAGTRNLPAGAGNPPTQIFDGRPAQIETGSPRGFFATLRRGRTFGIEATFEF